MGGLSFRSFSVVPTSEAISRLACGGQYEKLKPLKDSPSITAE
jgi:hypothetical protein